MGRTKAERKRIYKETVEKMLKQHGMNKSEFNDAMGHGKSWFPTTFAKGYYDISTANLRLWAFVIGCKEDELTEIPKAKEEPKAYTIANSAEAMLMTDIRLNKDMEELTALITDGFRMIHQDIQLLIETMDRYWKPEEPKYEAKEREQP